MTTGKSYDFLLKQMKSRESTGKEHGAEPFLHALHPLGDRRQALQRTVQELARVTSALPCSLSTSAGRGCMSGLQQSSGVPSTGRGPQAPRQVGGPDCMGDGEGQAELERSQDLQLLDGILA